jgi:hypothetical protein
MYLAEHPNRELSIEQIAKGTNLPFKSVAHALSRLLKLSVAKHGSASGYWIADVNARSDFNPSHRGSGVIASAGRQSVTPNGSSPARVRAESSSQLHDRDLMEVLRTRSDGRVVLVAENGDLYVATRIDV